MHAAVTAMDALECLRNETAMVLLAAAQAVDLRGGPAKLGSGSRGFTQPCANWRGSRIGTGPWSTRWRRYRPRSRRGRFSLKIRKIRQASPSGLPYTLVLEAPMILWKRAALLGFLSWMIPFAISFLLFPLKKPNAPLFGTLMAWSFF